MSSKVQNGQFYTVTNPFQHDAFFRWIGMMKKYDTNIFNNIWTEPFAGANNIVEHLSSLKITPKWQCFDIDPESQAENTSGEPVRKMDTLKHFPSRGSVSITNPPYLAKNSATRRGIFYPWKQDDLYKVCLDIMLSKQRWVAAIIPESFITQHIHHNRLYAVISLTQQMFEDTETPVCLALFMPTDIKTYAQLSINDFRVYQQDRPLNRFSVISGTLLLPVSKNKWTFNDPGGTIGILAIDNTDSETIRFVKGNTIHFPIKESCRSFTRISGLPSNIDLENFIITANQILTGFRQNTHDLFLTCFKGLRKDGKYRRRLDWENAKTILNATLDKMH